jgi:hypothetical protein
MSMYTKYVIAIPVSTISEYRMIGFCSTPLKYPFWRMLANTVLCRNIAPPKLLKPKPWAKMRSFLFKLGRVSVAIAYYQKRDMS